MQESTGQEKKTDNPGAGAESEATSKETLSDVEDNEEDNGSDGRELDPGPLPDGAFDEGDENKDAGPM